MNEQEIINKLNDALLWLKSPYPGDVDNGIFKIEMLVAELEGR